MMSLQSELPKQPKSC